MPNINRVRLATWRDRFASAKSKRDEAEAEGEWLLCKDIYNREHWKGITTTYQQLTFNICKTIIDIMRDATYYRNPTFKFSTFDQIKKEIVQTYEKAFPTILRKIRYKQQTKLALLDALKYGFGYKYNGFSQAGERGNDAIKPNEIFSIWVPHDKVWLDPDASGLWDANFIFYQVSVPFREFIKNEAYDIPKDAKPTGVSPLKSYFGENSGYRIKDDKDFDMVELIHVFDRGEGTHRIFVEGNENLSSYSNWVYKSKKWPLGDCNLFPINMLRLNENGLYPSGMLVELIDPNIEYNKMESMKLNHAKRFNRKYQSNKKLEKQQRDQLIAGEDGLLVEADDPEFEIKMIPDGDLTPAVYHSAQDMIDLMMKLARTSEFNMGATSTGETTATEATYVQQGASLGIDYVKDLISDFCQQDAEILTQLIKENYEDERGFEILGQPILWRGVDLEGADVNVIVDIESAGPPQSRIEKEDAITLLQQFGNDVYINPIKVREKVLDTFKTIKNPEEWLNTPVTMQLIAQLMAGMGPDAIKQFMDTGTVANAPGMSAPAPALGQSATQMPMETAEPGADIPAGEMGV